MASISDQRQNETSTSIGVQPTSEQERVVISGMSGAYPKANNIQEFSDILYNKVNPVTADDCRWTFNHPDIINYTGKIPRLSRFDAQFFKVYRSLSCRFDCMAKKILEHSFQAIYDAGISPDSLSGKKVGVYIGTGQAESDKGVFYYCSSVDLGLIGCSKTMFANRVSYWLNAKGPSIAMDQACCSSMAALQEAHNAIRRGDCEAAIVGGCYVCLHPQTIIQYGRVINLCADGKTKSFDQHADGCAKSEAVNILFLQNAKHALRVYAEVVHVKCEFTGLLDGDFGPKFGFNRDPMTTVKFMKRFYEEAQVPPEALEYLEACGTAIPEVDKAELEVIDEVFCSYRRKPLLVGSVMSNIGYTGSASGISGVTKILLGYHKGELAGNLHYNTPREDIAALNEGRLRILSENHQFEHTYAAVHNMSITGVNGHVLLKGHYKPKDLNRYKPNIPHLVTVSGRHEAAVERILKDIKSRPIDAEEIALFHKIHENKITGHMSRGFVILGSNDECETVSLYEKVNYFDDSRRPLWFVYSGMGSQWSGMGAQLMRMPIFAAAMQRCNQALKPKGLDIIKIITTTDKNIFDNILHSFVGIAAVQIGLTDVLTELGIEPDNIIGHSVGELVCAYADGCLTAEETILAAFYRGQVSVETPFIRGSMAAVGIGYRQLVKMCPPEIEVACHNGPDSSTISGPADVMSRFVAELTAKRIFAKEVPCSNIAYHSKYIADAGPQLFKYLKKVLVTPKLRSKRWLSTSVPQEKWNESIALYSSAEYYTNNLLNPVLFEETLRHIPSQAILVEIAPHGLLQAILKRSLHTDCRNIALTKRGHPNNVLLVLEAVGKLYMDGFHPKLHKLYPEVEFPVSTGTPMLSHLVEWNHEEKWPVILNIPADIRTAASCNFIICLHDSEQEYLRGNVFKDKVVYPYAAALVAVWDTLVMSLGLRRKQASVQFKDVHFHAQPVLHDQRQLKLHVAIHKGNGMFEVMDGTSKVVTGYVNIIKEANYALFNIETDRIEDDTINAEDIYEILSEKGFAYSGEFRSIHSANFSMSKALLVWNNNWVTLIEGMLQLNSLRCSKTGIPKLKSILNLTINVHVHISQPDIKREAAKRLFETKILEDFDIMRCGGIIMQKILCEYTPMFNSQHKIELRSYNIDTGDQNKNHAFENRDSPKIELMSDSRLMLQCTKIGDMESLKWVQDFSDTNSEGMKIKVHYVALNVLDAKIASGIVFSQDTTINNPGIGLDFSGISETGLRVMGLVREAARTQVRAHPHLLWPVPAHWTLEDAATVPLAYMQALYCLTHPCTHKQRKMDPCDVRTVLIQGGMSALGQAAISVALAFGYRVFTTVNSSQKKMLLKRLYPELKDEHINYSRGYGFYDMVMTETNGKGCDIVLFTAKGENRLIALKCCEFSGLCFDFGQLHEDKDVLPMNCLSPSRSYVAVEMSFLFDGKCSDLVQTLQAALSVGINKGYVRPLIRVVYAPAQASRACRLLANNRHLGRVLLGLRGPIIPAAIRLVSNPESCNLLICKNSKFGIQLVDRLIERGAKHFVLHYDGLSNQIHYKLEVWKRIGVQVNISLEKIDSYSSITGLLPKACSTDLEGIYIIGDIEADSNVEDYNSIIDQIDLWSRIWCQNLKHFAVISIMKKFGEQSILCRARNQLPATGLYLPNLRKLHDDKKCGITMKSALDGLENALLSKAPLLEVLPADRQQQQSILQQLAIITGKIMPSECCDELTIYDLGVTNENFPAVNAFLNNEYNTSLSEEQIAALTVRSLRDIEQTVLGSESKTVKGLEIFYSYIDSDELDNTIDIVHLPTLANSDVMIFNEFDTSQIRLCIIPGLEGCHLRFHEIFVRLQIPAFVLQPGFSTPNETIQQLAQRYAQVLIKKTGLKDNFYLMGYENGVAVALEVAAILEDLGFKGTVFCVGFLLEEFQSFLEQELGVFKTEKQLQDAVLQHMYTIITKDKGVLVDQKKDEAVTWAEKVDLCVRALLGLVPHSAQYLREVIEAAYARLVRAREYGTGAHLRPLRSKVVLLRASSAANTPTPANTYHRYSRQLVVVHQLDTALAHTTGDLRCASIINGHLAPKILEIFERKNLCDTYLLNRNRYIDFCECDY